MNKLVILRPEPGLSASLARAKEAGLEAIACPLMSVEPVEWSLPDLEAFDTLMFTSASAPAEAAEHRDALSALRVIAVGEKTAAAAREAGFTVAIVGDGGVDDLLEKMADEARILHLCGVNFRKPEAAQAINHLPVYRAVPTGAEPPVDGGHVYMVHSPRLGALLGMAIPEASRADKHVVAISQMAGVAVGPGWASVTMAPRPQDEAMLPVAAKLCQATE